MGPTLAYNGQSSIERCKFLSVVCVGIIDVQCRGHIFSPKIKMLSQR